MVLYGKYDFVQRQIEPFRRGLNDAQVGLMWNKPIQFALVDAGSVEGLAGDIAKGLDRNLEDLVALHQDRRFVRTSLV